MTRYALYLLSLTALAVSGCANKNDQDARQEEAFMPQPAPGYASLDSMDAVPPAEPAMDYQPAPQPQPVYIAPEPAADEELAPAGGQTYVVRKGDTLYKLARRFYNDEARWRDIWEANRASLGSPDKLSIGMKLVIP